MLLILSHQMLMLGPLLKILNRISKRYFQVQNFQKNILYTEFSIKISIIKFSMVQKLKNLYEMLSNLIVPSFNKLYLLYLERTSVY